MTLLLPLLALSASAVTVVAQTDRIVEEALERAVELRCPNADGMLMATVTDSDNDGFALVMIDLESSWLDDWTMSGDDYAGEDQTRALSMVICGRITTRPEPEPPAQTVERTISSTDVLGLRTFVGSTLTLNRPTLGARLERCFKRLCPEASLSLRIRPWGNTGRVEMLPDPTLGVDVGAGYAVRTTELIGTFVAYEGQLAGGGAPLVSGGLFVEGMRAKPLTWRGTFRWARAEWTETEHPQAEPSLVSGVRPAFEISATWRGFNR